MAKKRRSKGPPKTGNKSAAPSTPKPLTSDKEVVATPRPPPAIVALPAREPAFWFGFEVAWAKIAATRFLVFMLLALDAALQISHAPRYGAGGFNVGQLPFTGDLGASRLVFGAAQLVLAYMFVAIALGVATRVLVPVCAAVYAWLYFGSQLDSYQHHYLVAIVLVIASFVPWQRGPDVRPSTPVRSWALRLVLVQLAIMYVWAAISKLSPAWLDGTTLSTQMTGAFAEMIKASVGWSVASVLVIAVELALAVTIWARPAWRIAAPLGLAFHLGIVFTGLEIGLFAFLMVGIYALVIPDRFWIGVTTWLEGFAGVLARPSWVVLGAGLVTGIVLARLVRIEDAFAIGAAACVVPLAVATYSRVRAKRAPAIAVGVAHVLGIALWLFVDRATDVTEDYYRYWGGSQRRLGTPETAEYAYRRLTEVAPERESGHYHLGKLLIKRGATEEGLRHLREAQRLEPSIARAFVEEARVLQQQGKTTEAIEKARQATFADPSHAAARGLLDSLTGGKKPVPIEDDPPD
jgi:hypothetical protein